MKKQHISGRENFYWLSNKNTEFTQICILKDIPWPKLLAASFITWFTVLGHSNL